MAVPHSFTKFGQAMLNKKIQFVSSPDSIGCILLTSANSGPGGTTNVQATAEFVGDVIDNSSTWGGGGGTGPCKEVPTGGGYTSGGVSCRTPTTSTSGLTYEVLVASANNPSWTADATGFTANYALFFDSTPGTILTDPVICWWDFQAPQILTSLTFILSLPANGLLNLVAQ